jgi:hypothetical protein
MKNKLEIIGIFLLIFIAGFAIGYAWNLKPKQPEIEIIDPVIIELNIWETIQQTKIEHPHIVYAQYKLETGNGTSNLYLEHNNLFGMNYPRQRPTTATGSHNGFAVYDCWKHSIYDYAIWQSAFARGLSEKEYLAYLGRVYAEDKFYIRKIKQIIKK